MFADHTIIGLRNNNNVVVGNNVFIPTINGQAIISNSESQSGGDIQVACYMDMTNFTTADIAGNYDLVEASLKQQINKWLQTEILNNSTVTLSKPKPCILAFSDYQFTLYNYTHDADESHPIYNHRYYFRTPIISDNQTVKEITIILTTSLNSLQIAFDSYNINTITLNDNVIGGGGATGVIPTVETLANPTAESSTFVMYKGQLYGLVTEEEDK